MKIYLIEDNKKKIEQINTYFDSVNRLLNGKKYDSNKDYENSHVIFKNAGVSKIEIIYIKPEVEKKKYFNYIFDLKKDWVKKINEILREKENRVFMIDLALNSDERSAFERPDSFIAETAAKVLEMIADSETQKEKIIIESVLVDIDEKLRRCLDITNYNVFINKFEKIETIRSNLFSDSTEPKDAVANISSVFNYILDAEETGYER